MKELRKFFLPMPALLGQVAVFMMLLAAACSSVEEPAPLPEPTDELRTICQLSVSNTSSTSVSRAAGFLGEGYDTGLGFENYIDIPNYNFHFYYFDKDDKYLAELEIVTIAPLETTTISKTYSVQGKTPREVGDKEVKIVVLANWPEYPSDSFLKPGVTTIDDLWSFTYGFTPESMRLSDSVLIPLFGISPLQTLTYDAGGLANVGTIHLLRAYAKVEVIPAADTVYPITSVKLHRYNTKGFCAATVRDQDDYVKKEWNSDYTTTTHIPSGAESDETIDFMRTTDGHWLAYIPEYRNLNADGTPRPESELSYILVQFENDAEPYKVHFAEYDKTMSPSVLKNHFDIKRNVYYRFRLKRVFPGLEVDVMPYGIIDLKPSFGMDISRRLPDQLYVVGCIEDEDHFIIDRGYKLHQNPDNKYVYQGEVTLMGAFYLAENLSNGKGSVTMTYKEESVGTLKRRIYTVKDKTTAGDPFFTKGNRFSSKNANQRISTNLVVIFKEMEVPNVINLSHAAALGNYQMTVDFELMEIILEVPPSQELTSISKF